MCLLYVALLSKRVTDAICTCYVFCRAKATTVTVCGLNSARDSEMFVALPSKRVTEKCDAVCTFVADRDSNAVMIGDSASARDIVTVSKPSCGVEILQVQLICQIINSIRKH